MSLIYMDSFGQYGNSVHNEGAGTLQGEFWSGQEGNWELTNLETGRSRIHLAAGSANPSYLSGNFSGVTSTIVVGFRLYYIDSEANANCPIARFMDGGLEMGRIYFDGVTGKMRYMGANTWNNANKFESVSATGVGEDDHWTFKIYFHGSAGTVDIYYNGVLDASFTSKDTLHSGTECDTFAFIIDAGHDHEEFAFSDLYIDSATVHGDVKVTYEPCDTAGTESDWTPLASTNQSQVDEYDPDDDTTYISSVTPGDTDSLAHGASTTIGDVFGVQAVARVKKEDAADAGIKLGTKHSGSEELSDAKGVSTTYQWFHEMQEDVPGGSGWTETQSDAAETMIELVAV